MNLILEIMFMIVGVIFLCIFFMIVITSTEEFHSKEFNLKFLIKIIFIILLGIFLFFFAGNEIYNLNKYGLNYKEINYIKKNLSEEEKLKYEYCINNLSTYEEKDKFSTYMYLKLKEKEDRRIENMVNSF